MALWTAVPAAAQSWEVEREVDEFTGEASVSVQGHGEDGELTITASCHTDDFIVTVVDIRRLEAGSTSMASIFPRNGEARWDGGAAERFAFRRAFGSGGRLRK